MSGTEDMNPLPNNQENVDNHSQTKGKVKRKRKRRSKNNNNNNNNNNNSNNNNSNNNNSNNNNSNANADASLKEIEKQKQDELKKQELISKSRTIVLPKRIKNNGIRRLMCDYKDFLRNKNDEFPFINAKPLDNNIFEWHCNIFGHSGIYQGFIVHLQLIFTKEYPLTPPKVTILTPIAHGNVFDGYICLDMLKMSSSNTKYEGWTPAYSVSSILMQLQSFLFESSTIDQDYGGKAKSLEAQIKDKMFEIGGYYYNRYKTRFDTSLATMKSIKCKDCGHCYESPIPYVDNNNIKITLAKDFDELVARYQNEDIVANNKNNKKKKRKRNKNKNKTNCNEIEFEHKNNDYNNDNNKFQFWDEIYKDAENHILSFLNFVDLKRLMSVSKKFNEMAKQSRTIQRNGIECWFHRSYSIPCLDTNNPNAREQLCLGFGISPHFYEGYGTTKLRDQIFARSDKKDTIIDIKRNIGRYELISNIDITFDLLSSNAFEKYQIRQTIFKDRTFTQWIPLYINKAHGKLAMSLLKTYILRIFGKNDNENYHPYLALYAVANMMKSLIVSLMKASEEKEGIISLHYSINVLEAYLRLHHLLLAIYYHNKEQLQPIIQDQIDMFFESFDNDISYNSNNDYNNSYSDNDYDDDNNNCRNKSRIPDYGVFLMFLTLWEQDNNNNNNNNNIDNNNSNNTFDWDNGIGISLLDEIFTRQIKWLLDKYPKFACVEYDNDNISNNEKVKLKKERRVKMFEISHVSNRLFMFQYFFLTKVCQTFGTISNKNNNNNNSNRVSPTDKYFEYNNNNGLLNDSKLANKLQLFVKNSHKCRSFKEFFNIIDLSYPGDHRLSMWFVKCLKQSETRGYHKKTKKYGYQPQARPGSGQTDSMNRYSSDNYNSNYSSNYGNYNNYNRSSYGMNNSRQSSADMSRSWRR